MAEPAAVDAGVAAGQPSTAQAKFFKLPDFWPASPAAWFGVVDSQFRLRAVEREADKFALVAAVLPEVAARRVAHLLASPPAESPYTALKAALLSTHQLTDIQKAERLFNMDDLGARRPMELLTEMMELVQPGEEKTKLFAMLFLRKLPPAVRVQLTEDDHTDLRALAEKADRCAATLPRHSLEQTAVAAVESEAAAESELDIAAVKFKGKGGKQWHKNGGKKQQQGGSDGSKKSDSPAEMARLATGLCFKHFTYGSKAHGCRQPCSWQPGN